MNLLTAVLGYLVFLAAVVAYVTRPGPAIWTYKAGPSSAQRTEAEMVAEIEAEAEEIQRRRNEAFGLDAEKPPDLP